MARILRTPRPFSVRTDPGPAGRRPLRSKRLPACLRGFLLACLVAGLTVAAGGCSGPTAEGDADQAVSATNETDVSPPPDTGHEQAELAAHGVAVSHIFITFADRDGCPPTITRGRSEAHEMARRAVLRFNHGEDFATLAREYSDDPHAQENGGYLGIVRHGDLMFSLEANSMRLAEGQISRIIETPYGFHILKREVLRRCQAYHILIAWRDARKAAATVARTREQARALIEAVRTEALVDGADRCALARRYSDDAKNRASCGSLGWIEPGLLPGEVEEVIFALQPGELSAAVETEYGFHVFWRD